MGEGNSSAVRVAVVEGRGVSFLWDKGDMGKKYL